MWEDKDRYLLAFLEAKILLLQGRFSKSKLSTTLVAMQFGQVDTSEANLQLYFEGKKFKVVAPHLKLKGDVGSKEYRNRSIFNSMSEDRLRKIRALKSDPNSEEYEWFGGIVIAWKEALNPRHDDPGPLYRVCVRLGEARFFSLVLRPWFDAAHGRGPIPPLHLPDFIPHDGA